MDLYRVTWVELVSRKRKECEHTFMAESLKDVRKFVSCKQDEQPSSSDWAIHCWSPFSETGDPVGSWQEVLGG